MNLTANWRAVIRHAWSIRLIVLAGVMTGLEATLPLFTPLEPTPLFKAATFLVVVGAFAARLISQRKVTP